MIENLKLQIENSLSALEFRQILEASGIKKRPLDDLERLEKMCHHSNLIVTARVNNKIVGVARSFTDFVFCTYMSELAVSISHQKKGIGRRLIEFTKRQTPQALLVLLAAPEAVDYYHKIGLSKFQDCFLLKTKDLE